MLLFSMCANNNVDINTEAAVISIVEVVILIVNYTSYRECVYIYKDS